MMEILLYSQLQNISLVLGKYAAATDVYHTLLFLGSSTLPYFLSISRSTGIKPAGQNTCTRAQKVVHLGFYTSQKEWNREKIKAN